MGQCPRTRAPLKHWAPNPGEGRQHRLSSLLDPRILPLVGAIPALRMGHMAHPSEPLARTVKAGNPWAVTDRGGHDHEKEGLCDSHPLHQSLCRSCLGGLRWQRRSIHVTTSQSVPSSLLRMTGLGASSMKSVPILEVNTSSGSKSMRILLP